MTAKAAYTEDKQREVLVLESEVDTDRCGSAIPATLRKVHLVFAVDDAIAVLILILQVTRLHVTAKSLLRRVVDIGLVSEEAEALITPDGIHRLALTILIFVSIVVVVALGRLRGIVRQVCTTLKAKVAKVLLVLHSQVETTTVVLVVVQV